jgi:uncharacterized protein (DUF58 family)
MFQRLISFWDNTSVYLARLVFYALFAVAVLFMLGYLVPELFTVALVVLMLTIVAVVVDLYLLYRQQDGVGADRVLPDRLSNGDDNKVVLNLVNNYDHKIHCTIIDEQPYQLQQRHWSRDVDIEAGAETSLDYHVKPQERGEYVFGNINVFVDGPLKLARRRYIFQQEKTVKVYPSYMQMRRYQLHAFATHLQETGVKRMRKLGHSMEFEQIKEYVRGDDYRTLNWKATARHGNFMVNTYTDERSQQIYCVVNKGRVMKMPFGGMTLLDYAINASLVLCNVALQKHDKAGLITFAQQLDAFIPADKKPTQINNILETLYKQQTNFLEPDFERLFSVVRNRITQRSLIILFTNFESIESLERELPSLKRLAHYHLLVVVFFDNTELKELAESQAKTTEDIYIKTIAEKYRYEKQLIARELQKHGIISVLSTPQKLTINSLNKYLELKNNQSI